MTKRETARQAWRDYYRRSGQFERWQAFLKSADGIVKEISFWLRGTSNDDEERKRLLQALAEAENFKAFIAEQGAPYSNKPSRPAGRIPDDLL